MTATSPAPARYIEHIDLDELPPAERNPRTHEIAKIRASLKAFGCTVAGILDERTGRIVVGHGRRIALSQMKAEGGEAPDGILVEDGHWRVPIVRGWASASDAEAEGYLVADNRTGELGGWDDRALAEILDDLAASDTGLLDPTGYSLDDIDRLLIESGAYADRTTGYFDDPPAPGASDADEEDEEEGDDEDVDTDARDDGTRHEGDLEFVQVSWIVNADQRKTIRTALSRAQKLFNLGTSAVALCAIAERFLASHPEPDKEAA